MSMLSRDYRYINPNQAIEKLHPNFADERSILSLRFENPARILQKLPSCVMRINGIKIWREQLLSVEVSTS
ncbi:MAG: hypothetical protein SGI87_08270 [Flavobacteriales bacterium]|nr:hypothetical protein [Flavobacteriales bacterium]